MDTFHKWWLPITNLFVSIEITLTNVGFELIIQKNLCYQTSEAKFKYIQKNFKLKTVYYPDEVLVNLLKSPFERAHEH